MNNFGPVAQLVRAPPCHGGGRGFEPHPGRFLNIFLYRGGRKQKRLSQPLLFFKNFGILAQLGEHLPYKQRVTGSSPVGPICAGVAELADAQDLKSCGTYTPVSVRFRSPAYLKNFVGIAQLDRAFGYGPKGRGFESSCPRLILLESVNIALSPNGKALDSDSSISRFESW